MKSVFTRLLLLTFMMLFMGHAHATVPLDTDGDGLSDADEVTHVTNPALWDSDFDGALDNNAFYEFNGSITGAVFEDGVNIGAPGDMIAAFVDGEQRGVAPAIETPFGPYAGTYSFLMMIYSLNHLLTHFILQ